MNNNKIKNFNTKNKLEDHWTSKESLLTAMQNQTQESIENELFDNQIINNVDLKAIFNGQKFIRVHKQLRPIDYRRETIFKN